MPTINRHAVAQALRLAADAAAADRANVPWLAEQFRDQGQTARHYAQIIEQADGPIIVTD